MTLLESSCSMGADAGQGAEKIDIHFLTPRDDPLRVGEGAACMRSNAGVINQQLHVWCVFDRCLNVRAIRNVKPKGNDL